MMFRPWCLSITVVVLVCTETSESTDVVLYTHNCQNTLSTSVKIARLVHCVHYAHSTYCIRCRRVTNPIFGMLGEVADVVIHANACGDLCRGFAPMGRRKFTIQLLVSCRAQNHFEFYTSSCSFRSCFSCTVLHDYTPCLRKTRKLWNGIAQNYKDRFWWHLAEIFKIL